MITYNNIVDIMNVFADNHFMINSFTHGGVDDADNKKEPLYPTMHLVYNGATYEGGDQGLSSSKTYNIQVYFLDLPTDKLNKQDHQKELISDLEQVAEDLLADIRGGFNVFKQIDHYEVTSFGLTPLEEEESNTLSGVLLDLSLQVPYLNDSCNLPLESATFTGVVCEPATVENSDQSYQTSVNSGGTLVLPKIRVEEVDGSSTSYPSVVDITCAWSEITIKDSENNTLDTLNEYPAGGEVVVNPAGGADATVSNSDDSYSATVSAGGNLELPDITVTDPDGTTRTEPSVQDITCTQATNSPFIIPHRPPSYSSISTNDYADLWANGYFDIYRPSGIVNMSRLGADAFTLAENNPFGNSSRYTSTDGTESDTGTARFSSWGSGVQYVVIDWLHWIMVYNQPFGPINWNGAQGLMDTNLNTPSVAGYSDWVCGTRDMIVLSCAPDSNADIHDSPNLIDDTGTRRYVSCERLPYQGFGYIIFHSNNGESAQSLTSTVSNQTRALGMRLLSQSDIDALTA